MIEQSPPVHFLLLRVEGTAAEERATLLGTLPTFAGALAAAADEPHQPDAAWKPDRVDGVWRQVDAHGHGFVVHRIDDPATGFGDNGNGGGNGGDLKAECNVVTISTPPPAS
jgi:hypothetical protein